jgi:hypothetical protein
LPGGAHEKQLGSSDTGRQQADDFHRDALSTGKFRVVNWLLRVAAGQYFLYPSGGLLFVTLVRDVDETERDVQSIAANVIQHHIHRKIADIVAGVR